MNSSCTFRNKLRLRDQIRAAILRESEPEIGVVDEFTIGVYPWQPGHRIPKRLEGKRREDILCVDVSMRIGDEHTHSHMGLFYERESAIYKLNPEISYVALRIKERIREMAEEREQEEEEIAREKEMVGGPEPKLSDGSPNPFYLPPNPEAIDLTPIVERQAELQSERMRDHAKSIIGEILALPEDRHKQAIDVWFERTKRYNRDYTIDLTGDYEIDHFRVMKNHQDMMLARQVVEQWAMVQMKKAKERDADKSRKPNESATDSAISLDSPTSPPHWAAESEYGSESDPIPAYSPQSTSDHPIIRLETRFEEILHRLDSQDIALARIKDLQEEFVFRMEYFTGLIERACKPVIVGQYPVDPGFALTQANKDGCLNNTNTAGARVRPSQTSHLFGDISSIFHDWE